MWLQNHYVNKNPFLPIIKEKLLVTIKNYN